MWRLAAGAERPIETVVARHLGASPDSVRVRRSRQGKPEIDGTELSVSLAHSGRVALVAVAPAADLGVDVEALRPDVADWALVDHALSDQERARLQGLPEPQQAESFLRSWTRKEAILKAAGTGLGLDPRLVELDDLHVAALPPELGLADSWILVDVPLAGYAASLAVRGRLASVSLYDPRSDGPRTLPLHREPAESELEGENDAPQEQGDGSQNPFDGGV